MKRWNSVYTFSGNKLSSKSPFFVFDGKYVKIPQKMILTSKRQAKHMLSGQNTQHLDFISNNVQLSNSMLKFNVSVEFQSEWLFFHRFDKADGNKQQYRDL